MEGISGLSSGIDTSSLIQTMLEIKGQPLERLKTEKDELQYDKELFQSLNTELLDFKNTLLKMRLESTFKSRTVISTDDTIVNATATPEAAIGKHSMTVEKLATEARAISSYVSAKLMDLVSNETNIDDLSGISSNNLNGAYDMKFFDAKSYELTSAGSGESYTASGKLGTSIDATNNHFEMTVYGQNISFDLNNYTANSNTLTQVAADMASKINDALNTAFSTSGEEYVSVDTVSNTGVGNDSLVIELTKGGYQNTLEIDYAASTADSVLGFVDGGDIAHRGSDAYVSSDFEFESMGRRYSLVADSSVEEDADFSKAGRINANIDSSNNELTMDIEGETITITLDNATAGSTSMRTIAKDIEAKVNEALNEKKDTVDVTYFRAIVDAEEGLGDDKLRLINTAPGVSSHKIENLGGSAASVLGFGSGGVSEEISKIEEKIYDTQALGESSGLSSLLTKVNDELTSLIDGMEFQTSGDLQEGEIQIAMNSSLNVTPKIEARVLGAKDISESGALNIGVVNLENAGLKTEPGQSTNGYFTIEGYKIEIDNYQTLSINDVLSKINSSGAQVNAYYDEDYDRIIIESTSDDNKEIDLGGVGDTSNFLTLAGLTSDKGAKFIKGENASAIDPKSTLVEGNFTTGVTSGTFSINGVSIYINAQKDTLNDVLEKITDSGANVNASYDVTLDRITFSSKLGGETNTKRIEVGSLNDTSNFLEAINMLRYNDLSVTGQAQSGNRASDIIQIVDMDGNTKDITLTATNASGTNGGGAYTGALQINFDDGIAAGAEFEIAIDGDSTNLYRWKNKSGEAITDIDTFVEEWNKGLAGREGNWTYMGQIVSTPIKAVKVSDTEVKFFRTQGGAASSFEIVSETNAGDAAEIGLALNNLENAGAAATADAEYNALNFIYDIQNAMSSELKLATDGSGKITIEPRQQNYLGKFQIKDTGDLPLNTIMDFFGEDNVMPQGMQREIGERGSDAVMTVDGVDYVRSTNYIDDILGGITLDLQNESTSTQYIEIKNDNDNTIEAVAEFIVNYNKIIKTINPEPLSKEQRNYLPQLTTEKMNAMTYSEIEEYNYYRNLYKQTDLFQRDSGVQGLFNSVKQVMTKALDGFGDLNGLAALNITSPGLVDMDATKRGVLIEDVDDMDDLDLIVDKLKSNSQFMSVLEEDPDIIYDIFGGYGEKELIAGGDSNNPNDYTLIKEAGISRLLSEKIDDFIGIGGILKEKIRYDGLYDKRINSVSSRITSYEDRLAGYEERMKKEFQRMEEAISKLQAQSSELSAQLASLSGTTS